MQEGKKRWQQVKNDPEKLSKTRAAIEKYRKTDAYRKSKAKSDKKYYEKNKENILAYKSEWNELKRFGVKREEIIERDGRKCAHCQTSDLDSLVIHHIDNEGRKALKDGEEPNNDPANLITLCRSCHARLHLKR